MSEDLIPYGNNESIIDEFDRLTGNLPVATGLEYTEAIIIDNGVVDQSQYIAQRNNMPTPPAILSVLSSKKEAASFANFVIDLVKDNELYALNVWKQILCFEYALDYIKKNIQANAIAEAEKAMDKNISISSRKTFDFKICGDDYLIELYNLQAQVKEQIKERETLHKAHKGEQWTEVDSETGEIKLFMPPTPEKSTPVLTIKGL